MILGTDSSFCDPPIIGFGSLTLLDWFVELIVTYVAVVFLTILGTDGVLPLGVEVVTVFGG